MDIKIQGGATGAQRNATLPGPGVGGLKAAAVARFANYIKGQDLNNAAIYSQLTGGNFQVDVPDARVTAAPAAHPSAASSAAPLLRRPGHQDGYRPRDPHRDGHVHDHGPRRRCLSAANRGRLRPRQHPGR